MRANNQKKKSGNPRLGLFTLLLAMFASAGMDEQTSHKRAFHQAFMEGGHPEFYPRKHTVMSYAKQNRLAKQRRKSKLKKS